MLIVALSACTFSAGIVSIIPFLVAGYTEALLSGACALHCKINQWIQVEILHVSLLDLHLSVYQLRLQT